MKNIILSLLLLIAGCSKADTPSDIGLVALTSSPSPTPLANISPPSSPSPSPLSQALPELERQKTLGEVDSTNDLLDSFYFDGNGIKISLKVGSNEACYVYIRRSTPEKLCLFCWSQRR